MDVAFVIVAIIITIIINSIYHKIFDVTYFGCAPFITEWFVCFMIGATISGFFFGMV